MSDARETLRLGDARGALEQLKHEVRQAPRDARLRVFLCQLFCIFGEWERAVAQLAVADQPDPLAVTSSPLLDVRRVPCVAAAELVAADS